MCFATKIAAKPSPRPVEGLDKTKAKREREREREKERRMTVPALKTPKRTSPSHLRTYRGILMS